MIHVVGRLSSAKELVMASASPNLGQGSDRRQPTKDRILVGSEASGEAEDSTQVVTV